MVDPLRFANSKLRCRWTESDLEAIFADRLSVIRRYKVFENAASNTRSLRTVLCDEEVKTIPHSESPNRFLY